MKTRTIKREDENIRNRHVVFRERANFLSWLLLLLLFFWPVFCGKDFRTYMCWTSVTSNDSSPTYCICVFYATVTTVKCVFKWNWSSYNPWASVVSFIQLQVAMKFSHKFFWEMWSYLRLQTCLSKSYFFYTLNTSFSLPHWPNRPPRILFTGL